MTRDEAIAALCEIAILHVEETDGEHGCMHRYGKALANQECDTHELAQWVAMLISVASGNVPRMEWTVSDVDNGYYWVILVDGDTMIRQHPIPFTDRREAVRGAVRLNKRDFDE